MAPGADWFDGAGRDDVLSGGVRTLPVRTSLGTFNVWTKRVGNNPDVKLLLLHGGPGATHEYFEGFDTHLPGAGVEYYYYDQLGSHYSDQPEAPELWEVDRFVDEVEQVRRALGLDSSNFFLLGQSWGGILAIEYALRHQEHLKGLVVSNMMASIPAYNRYAETVLMPPMDQAALAQIQALEASGQTSDPRYEQLLMEHHYVHHVLRMPAGSGPSPSSGRSRTSTRTSTSRCRGPASSALGEAGRLGPDRGPLADPRAHAGHRRRARHDGPGRAARHGAGAARGSYLHCPRGSHLAMYDDQQTYMRGLVDFLLADHAPRDPG